MGKSQRDKGKGGEREAAHEIQGKWGISCRRGAQFAGRDGSHDLVPVAPDGSRMAINAEVKRCEALSLYRALDQAIADALASEIPVIFHRRNHKPWLVILRLDDVPAFVKEFARCSTL